MTNVTYVLGKHRQPSQTFVSDEIAELERQGVEVHVLAVERGDASPHPTERVTFLAESETSRIAVVAAHAGTAVRHPLRYLHFLWLVRRLRSEMGTRPEQVPWTLVPGAARDVRRRGSVAVHAHFAWSGAAAAELVAVLTGLPWSVTLHAKDIFSKQRNLSHKLARADRLVTVCRYNEEWMRAELGLRRPVLQVACGVQVPTGELPAKHGIDVVAVGRLVEKKGFDVLIDAVAHLSRRGRPVTVEIVGDGPERARLADRIRRHGLQSTVRLAGSLDHEAALQRIAGARVLALPCRIASDGDRDSMPVVIKEAMARRVPVVATRVVAVPEMLSDGCGLMVEPEDAVGLGQQIEVLLTDATTAEAVARRAYERVLERFTLAGEVATLRTALFERDIT